MSDEETPSPFPPRKERASRSEARREALEMLDWAEALADLPKKRRESSDLPPMLMAAVRAAAAIPSHAARKRQIKLLAQQLRLEDDAVIEIVRALLEDGHRIDGEVARDAEAWVVRLLEDPEALTAFIAAVPGLPVQTLTSRLRAAQKGGARERRQLVTVVREGISRGPA